MKKIKINNFLLSVNYSSPDVYYLDIWSIGLKKIFLRKKKRNELGRKRENMLRTFWTRVNIICNKEIAIEEKFLRFKPQIKINLSCILLMPRQRKTRKARHWKSTKEILESFYLFIYFFTHATQIKGSAGTNKCNALLKKKKNYSCFKFNEIRNF